MNRLRHFLVTVVAVIAFSLFARTSFALPRLSVRLGVPCATCHVNPSGGGMRNNYGSYVFAPTRLPLAFPGSSTTRVPMQLDIGDSLSFGGDARTALIYQKPMGGGDGLLSFFQMQADLYVAARLFDGLTAYYDQGAWGSFEAMGIYQKQLAKSASVYVKAGRFMPTYGLRLENHNLYTRQDIGFGPRDKDQGVEVGTQLGPLLVQLSVLNGSPQERQLDDNHSKAFIGRAETLGRLGPLKLMFGGSVYKNETGSVTEVHGASIDGRTKHSRYGVFGGASLGRLTYLAEAHLVKDDPYSDNKQDSKTRSFQSYQELDVLLIRGIDLNFNYEFRDPNLDLRTGTIQRISAGFAIYPMPYLELTALYRYSFARGPAGPEVQPLAGLKELIAIAHLYF